jgi:hypothetical protein
VDVEALVLQKHPYQLANVRVVVDYQNLAHCSQDTPGA